MTKMPFWTQIDEPGKPSTWRLFGQQNARTWLAEVRIADGYTVFLNMGEGNQPLALPAHAELQAAMSEAEDRYLSEGVRDRVGPSRRAILEAMVSPPAVIIGQAPTWTWNRNTGRMDLVDAGFRINVLRDRLRGRWVWSIAGNSFRFDIEETREAAMCAVEDALSLSAHQRLAARQALSDRVQAIRARVRDDVRKSRESRLCTTAYWSEQIAGLTR